MCIHIKSHNIDMNDGDSEDEREDNITEMGEELAHKSVEKQKNVPKK